MVLYTWWKLFSFVISFVSVTHLVCPSWHLGAPLRGPWVSPWSKPYASTEIKKKKKKNPVQSRHQHHTHNPGMVQRPPLARTLLTNNPPLGLQSQSWIAPSPYYAAAQTYVHPPLASLPFSPPYIFSAPCQKGLTLR